MPKVSIQGWTGKLPSRAILFRTHSVCQDGHQVIENSRDFAEEGSDPFGAVGHFDVCGGG